VDGQLSGAVRHTAQESAPSSTSIAERQSCWAVRGQYLYHEQDQTVFIRGVYAPLLINPDFLSMIFKQLSDEPGKFYAQRRNGSRSMAHPDRSNLQAYLAKLTGHTVLTAQEQETILSLPFHIEQVAANRDFVSLGESVDHVSVIASGFVGRFDQNSNGERQITAIHVPGDAANLHSVVQPQAASALQSLSASTVLRIPHQAIRAVAARHPAVAEALWRDCIVDAAISSQWIVNVGRRDAQSRIGHLFCELAIRAFFDQSGSYPHDVK